MNDSRVRIRTLPNLQSETIKYINKDNELKIMDITSENMISKNMEVFWIKEKQKKILLENILILYRF